MSRFYGMSKSRLRDELDRLEEQLYEYETEFPDDYDGRRDLQDMINNICNLLFRKEGNAA